MKPTFASLGFLGLLFTTPSTISGAFATIVLFFGHGFHWWDHTPTWLTRWGTVTAGFLLIGLALYGIGRAGHQLLEDRA